MGKKIKKRMRFLQLLQRGKRDVILALLQEKGIQGLGEREIVNFINLCHKNNLDLRQGSRYFLAVTLLPPTLERELKYDERAAKEIL